MSTLLGSLRRLALSPSLTDVSFAARGFPVTPTDATRALEAIPQAVVCGFEWGIDFRRQADLTRRLDMVDAELRGFAYEGATMALTVRDAMAAGRGQRTRRLLTGPGRPHTFLTYIGIGFAMARLPRPLWRGVLPDLTGEPYYPTMSWLAVDGYGFDRAYFDTDVVVNRQRRLDPYPWRGRADYFPRAVDQGVGRALWFIHGGVPDAVGAAVRRFATDRHADLWSGVGLAATFAGGCDETGLKALREDSGTHWPHLAQGAVFAAKARDFSGFVAEHTRSALHVLAELTVPAASALADDVSLSTTSSDEPDYESWRRQVRAHLDRK
ncbi:DUF1702 family protein [Micromonospora sp. PLK6-60]|uniref:DUF1702 family protein n=1 Tax=Micromonospora sp. PLK6-60 TaxID=2873383 RepID=UPI001CA65BDF|nr:DUF1702 family protein [Micromonospora sp. PLK6-60]MBY8870753.1 DUF1702 family protein [Micromonospora sp. PLK6-60]